MVDPSLILPETAVPARSNPYTRGTPLAVYAQLPDDYTRRFCADHGLYRGARGPERGFLHSGS